MYDTALSKLTLETIKVRVPLTLFFLSICKSCGESINITKSSVRLYRFRKYLLAILIIILLNVSQYFYYFIIYNGEASIFNVSLERTY